MSARGAQRCACCSATATRELTIGTDAPSPRCAEHWRAEVNAALENGQSATVTPLRERGARLDAGEAYDRHLDQMADRRDDDQRLHLTLALEDL